MSAGSVRVRFAPSPTGELHVGNARTALFNWLFARRYGGTFVLRMEDTDQERSSHLYAEHLLEDLRWLGLSWDEGPEVGGAFGPYRQMERGELYRACLEKLIAADCVYPCYCTESELEAERKAQLGRGVAPRYGGKCRDLTEAAKRRFSAEGRPAAFRFRVGSGPIEFHDAIRGPMVFQAEAMGDFIIVRSAGIPAYNFAVVVDDHHMAISHVIRGEDHLSNTAAQILLYRAMGFTPPRFAHHALILGRDRTKLSKRHGAVSVREFRTLGVVPEALVNYLALLGSSFGEGGEIRTLREMVDAFTLERAGKSGAFFDVDKLRWINMHFIRQYQTERLVEAIKPFARNAGYDPEVLDPVWLRAVVETARDNLTTLADISAYLTMFSLRGGELTPEARALLEEDDARRVVQHFADVLRRDEVSYEDAIKEVSAETGAKGKRLYLPLRAAATGSLEGPELIRIFALLGRDTLRRRLAGVLPS